MFWSRIRTFFAITSAVICLLLVTPQSALADYQNVTDLCRGCTLGPIRVNLQPAPARQGEPFTFDLIVESATALSTVTVHLDYYYQVLGMWIAGSSDTEQVGAIPAGLSTTTLTQDLGASAPTGNYSVTIRLTTGAPETTQGHFRVYFFMTS